MDPIYTHVGTILAGDNRFLGHSVYEEWISIVKGPEDPLLRVLGVKELNSLNREVFRLLSLCVISSDARVWPLKLTRLLSSWGNPLVGYLGSQLVATSNVMGPGATTNAAKCLQFVNKTIGSCFSTEAIKSAIEEWICKTGMPLAGFGVPFRGIDERRAALLHFVGNGPISKRAYWQLHEKIVLAQSPVPPNCILSFAAMLLDAGVPAERCGFAVTVFMSHVFLAHAIEAATIDGVRLNAWSKEQVKYDGTSARITNDGTRGKVNHALKRVL